MSDDDRTSLCRPAGDFAAPLPPVQPAQRRLKTPPPLPTLPQCKRRALRVGPEGENLVAGVYYAVATGGQQPAKRPISEVARFAGATEMVTQIAGTKPRAEAQSRILKGRFVIEEILGAGGMGCGVQGEGSTKSRGSRPRTLCSH